VALGHEPQTEGVEGPGQGAARVEAAGWVQPVPVPLEERRQHRAGHQEDEVAPGALPGAERHERRTGRSTAIRPAVRGEAVGEGKRLVVAVEEGGEAMPAASKAKSHCGTWPTAAVPAEAGVAATRAARLPDST
jgi:hypothetical protein